MTVSSCLMEVRPRVSGRLWHFSPSQETSFKESGVGGVRTDRAGRLLELRLESGEKIVGTEVSSENQAAVWTEKGNIFIVTVKANRYRKMGKPGLVNCLKFVSGDPVSILVGLKTKKLLVIDTDTGVVKKRMSEDEDIFSVGSGGDVLYSLTSLHLTLFSSVTGLQLLRLRFRPEARVEFVELETEGGVLRAVTACRTGKMAVWDLKINQQSEASLRTSLDLKRNCSHFSLSGSLLYYAVARSVFGTNLAGEVTSERVYSGEEEVRGLVVRTVRDRVWLLVTLVTRTVFLCDGNILAELPFSGKISMTGDGFLMMVTREDGVSEVVRTAEIWSRTAPVPVTSITSDRLRPSEDRVKCRPVGTKTKSEAEVEREEKSISQMSSLLRPGLLSYPALQRPAIWASLLELPRNKKRQLSLCRRHNTDPADVVSSLTAWSPDLHLVPHLSSLLQPFLRLYSGHSTTALEVSMVLLTSFSSLTSYPAPSLPQVTAWSLLAQERPHLASHLTSLSASGRTVFWPVLQSGWRSALSHSDWCWLWDHLITEGPHLVVATLLALPISLENDVMTCTSLTMVNTLFSSQLTLDMSSFLRLSYNLLEKYRHQILPVVTPLPDLRAGYPPPILLEKENKVVLQELQPNLDSVDFIPAGSKVEAQCVSPPPVPRLRTHSRLALLTSDKENSQTSPAVAGPLMPGYPGHAREEDEELEDIQTLLGKAKVLRQLVKGNK